MAGVQVEASNCGPGHATVALRQWELLMNFIWQCMQPWFGRQCAFGPLNACSACNALSNYRPATVLNRTCPDSKHLGGGSGRAAHGSWQGQTQDMSIIALWGDPILSLRNVPEGQDLLTKERVLPVWQRARDGVDTSRQPQLQNSQ